MNKVNQVVRDYQFRVYVWLSMVMLSVTLGILTEAGACVLVGLLCVLIGIVTSVGNLLIDTGMSLLGLIVFGNNPYNRSCR